MLVLVFVLVLMWVLVFDDSLMTDGGTDALEEDTCADAGSLSSSGTAVDGSGSFCGTVGCASGPDAEAAPEVAAGGDSTTSACTSSSPRFVSVGRSSSRSLRRRHHAMSSKRQQQGINKRSSRSHSKLLDESAVLMAPTIVTLVGAAVGREVGARLGVLDGAMEGEAEGRTMVGARLGAVDGVADGAEDGEALGRDTVGARVGADDCGAPDGDTDGDADGTRVVGEPEGALDGARDGANVGENDGTVGEGVPQSYVVKAQRLMHSASPKHKKRHRESNEQASLLQLGSQRPLPMSNGAQPGLHSRTMLKR